MAENTVQTIWDIALNKQSLADSQKRMVDLTKQAGALGEQLELIERQDALEKLAKRYGTVAQETGNTVEAAKRLNAELEKMGVTGDELKGLSKTFADAASAKPGEGGKGGGAPGAGKFRGAASLFGGGDIVGLLDDLQDGVEGFQDLTKSVTEGGTSAAGAAVSFGLAAAATIALSLAVKQYQDTLKDAQALLDSTFAGKRKVQQDIRGGLTTEEATERLTELQGVLADETENRRVAEENYQKAFKQSVEQVGDAATRALDATGAFDSFKREIDTADGFVKDATSEMTFLGNAMKDGSLAANDAAAAEEKLKEEREKAGQALIDSANVAGQEVEARQRAMKATEEQNRARLTSIDDERAAIEAQLAVLKSSGNTSEAVAEQIAKLEGQIGSLGKEADFINSTALEASKKRDAEKKAAEVAEQVEQKRLSAARKYSDTLVDIARRAADDAEKLVKGLKQKLVDNQADALQDVADIGAEFADSEREEAIQRGEQEALDLRQHANRLAGIRDEAFNTEKDFIRKRDFLSATKVRENAIALQEAEIKTFKDGQGEKIQAQKSEDAAQLRELDKARRERMTLLQRANEEARQQYQRDVQNQKDSRRIAEREAKIARDREEREIQALQNTVIGVNRTILREQVAAGQAAISMIRSMTNTTNNNTVNNNQRSVGNISISGASVNPAAIRQTMYEVLGEIGVV